MQRALKGLRGFQEAPRRPRREDRPIAARVGRAIVRDYAPDAPRDAPAVLFVPSVINPPHVLDLDEERSLLRWLAMQGFRPLLLDWGEPSADEAALSIAGHVETMLLPLIDQLPQPLTIAGYCLGGTMGLAAAALRPLRALALIAAPWRFSGFPQASRDSLAALWRQSQPLAEQLGLLPVEVLQTAFWQLDPARVIAKYARFGELAPDSAEARGFVALEDWANEGPPLTAAAGRELAEDFFTHDLPGQGRWSVGGTPIVPDRLACPVLDIASTSDRIVPAASAAAIGTQLSLSQGHVGMIVGRRARAALWEPLAAWLADPT